jgi:hypothetical protein
MERTEDTYPMILADLEPARAAEMRGANIQAVSGLPAPSADPKIRLRP